MTASLQGWGLSDFIIGEVLHTSDILIKHKVKKRKKHVQMYGSQ